MKYLFSIYNNGRKKNHFGLTLIELLVVISVLATLTAGIILIINPTTQINKTRDAKRKNDLLQIQQALESYYNDYQKYPCWSTGCNTSPSVDAAYNLSGQLSDPNIPLPSPAGTQYLSIFPSDPNTSSSYNPPCPNSQYLSYINDQPHLLFANLSISTDAQATASKPISTTFSPGISSDSCISSGSCTSITITGANSACGGSAVYNYWIAKP